MKKTRIPVFAILITIVFTLLNCEPLIVDFDSDYLDQDNQTIQSNASDADLIFVGTITEIGTAPLFWSGIALSLQDVTYTVDSVIKGSYLSSEITVSHVLVDESYLAADDAPGLSTTLFAASFVVHNCMIDILVIAHLYISSCVPCDTSPAHR